MLKQINGTMLRKMIIAGASLLEQNKKNVDALNVFPVPDGDTGTNMTLTFKSVLNEVGKCQNNNIPDLAECITKGALKGARGNSGVILSQILKGMSTVIGQVDEAFSTKVFAKSLEEGAKVAYKAVTKPKEGTVLTVVRIMSEAAMMACKKTSDFEEFFKIVLDKGEEILQQTPEMLPVLKKAGVVDAGGRGLLIIFTGFFKAILGEENFNYVIEDTAAKLEDNISEANLNELGNIEFAYCTEFMIIEMYKKTTLSDIDKLTERLMEIGDSVICTGDLSLVKVHVHTNEPNKALGYALELGELTNLKIENMLEQNRALKRARAEKEAQNSKPFGIVAVCAGDGLETIFKDINVDELITGGQTMNPSAEDISKAVEKVPSQNVFVFPNNKNIILAAVQAQDLTKKKIYVVPSTSIPEGITGILELNPEGTVEENFEAMKEAIKRVKSAMVTYAVRDTSVDGLDVKKGSIIGLTEKNILVCENNIEDATIKLIEKLIDDNTVNITLFFGEGVTEADSEAFRQKLEKKFNKQEVSMLYGGQPVYYYLISIE